MKLRYLSILILFFTLSCTKEEICDPSVSLEGTWQLKATLVDIGDGNGSYKPVVEYYSVTFLTDSTFVFNESICDSPVGNTNPTTGIYSATSLTYDANDCFDTAVLNYELRGYILIIRPMCFEACGLKYWKVG